MADENFTVVSVLDPGIDTERMPRAVMSSYLATRDIDKVRPYVKPGAVITEYRCREIPHALWESWVMAGPSEYERLKRAFQCGVMNVKNMRQRDGTTVTSWDPPQAHGGMAEESLGRFSAAVRAEIGQVIWQRSFLAPLTVPTYLLPDIVHACLVERVFLHAASSPSSLETSSVEASSASAATQAAPSTTDSASATCGSGSEAPTAATAAESNTQAA